jgi:hypothetical protein
VSATVISAGFDELIRYFEALPDATEEAMMLAINEEARNLVPALKRKMFAQVSFPKEYLNNQRLGVRSKATRKSLEAIVSGRDRPTSLARFAPGATVANSRRKPLFVQVKPGVTRKLKNAFLVNLRNGNTGLAVRLKDGETLQKSDKAVRLDNNLYLLYGPSVDQVMAGVADEVTPDILDNLRKKFLRQFGRVTSRG